MSKDMPVWPGIEKIISSRLVSADCEWNAHYRSLLGLDVVSHLDQIQFVFLQPIIYHHTIVQKAIKVFEANSSGLEVSFVPRQLILFFNIWYFKKFQTWFCFSNCMWAHSSDGMSWCSRTWQPFLQIMTRKFFVWGLSHFTTIPALLGDRLCYSWLTLSFVFLLFTLCLCPIWMVSWISK